MADVVDSDERVFAALVAKNPNGAARSRRCPTLHRSSMHELIKRTIVASAFGLAIVGSAGAASVATASETSPMVFYRTVMVDGLSIFYCEAGRPDAPTLLLLHGFPSSSRMYEPLLTRLSAYYHLVAPDYPGFGHGDAPGA